MFFDRKTSYDDRLALIDQSGESMTYGDMYCYSQKLSEVLSSRSVVLFLCDYSIETVCLYFNMLQIGMVPLLVSKNADKDYIASLDRDYRPRYIWFSHEREDIRAVYKSKKVVFEQKQHFLYEINSVKYDLYPELALLLVTSGSTGSSKVVRLSYKNIVENASLTKEAFDYSSYDRGITILPMHHCYGLNLIHTCWDAGACVCLYEGTIIDPKFIRFVEKVSPTITYIVPYSIELLRYIDFKKMAHYVKKVVIAGEKMDNSQAGFIRESAYKEKIQLIYAYGQTEGTSILSSCDGKQVNDTRCIGKALSGLKTYISNPNKEGIGDLYFEGESVSLGYANNYIDLAKGDELNGKLNTGDIARIDSEGFIYLYGRKKRIVKILGERVSLDDLEALLGMEYRNCEFVCIGKTNGVCILYMGEELDADKVKDYLFMKAHIYKNAINVNKIDIIPRNNSGKISYSKLEEAYL